MTTHHTPVVFAELLVQCTSELTLRGAALKSELNCCWPATLPLIMLCALLRRRSTSQSSGKRTML